MGLEGSPNCEVCEIEHAGVVVSLLFLIENILNILSMLEYAEVSATSILRLVSSSGRLGTDL
jgi:hypothetical protein